MGFRHQGTGFSRIYGLDIGLEACVSKAFLGLVWGSRFRVHQGSLRAARARQEAGERLFQLQFQRKVQGILV